VKESQSPLSFSSYLIVARCMCIKWSDIKSQKMQSVAHWSRRIIPNPREMADGILKMGGLTERNLKMQWEGCCYEDFCDNGTLCAFW
jgi:hypothetical protein